MDALSGLRTFRHGTHPEAHKDTAGLPTERMPFGARYVLPLSQHTGAPSRPVVAVGDRVVRGQLIAEPAAWVSVGLHAPVTGTVASLASRRHPNGQVLPAIEIETDPYASQRLEPGPARDPARMDRKAAFQVLQQAGIVGMGGAAFPTHVKLSVPEGRTVHTLIVNGAECEPYLTCDHRVMLEHPREVIRGVRIAMGLLGVERAILGLEANKADAVEALRREVPDGSGVEVTALQVKYPQGAEKMLIFALLGAVVPAGGLPMDVGVVVINVGTMVAIADAFDRGWPLVERTLTVAGPGIREPANLVVPIGTPVRDVLARCGMRDDVRLLLLGGPMMGVALSSLDIPVLKGTSGLLAFTERDLAAAREFACVRCGRCLDACACFLNPSRLGLLARVGRYEEMEEHHVMDCMECAACSFVCPSGIPLVHLFRQAKAEIRKKKASR